MSQIKLKHSGGNSSIIAAPSSNPASDVTFRLPNADGSAGQFMKTDGSGNLSFAAGGTTINNNADNRVITGSGTANTLEGEASLTFDDGLLKIDDTGGTAGKGRLEFGNSNEQFIEGFDAGNAGSGSYLKFGQGATERMRIDSSGNIIVDSSASFAAISQITSTHDGSRFGLGIHNTNTGTDSQMAIRFMRNNSGVGSITTTNSATAFNTSSDYRLKENAVAISDGITRLKTLKPYRFNWKSDSSTIVDGFFAHEVTAVPEAISGTKDAVATKDEPLKAIKKGDPIYQSIDQSKLVPLLTAALQEAIAKIETLETKVAALEAG